MSRSTSSHRLPSIGWREWVGLPDLGVAHVKVKVDTGARTSALHAFDCEFSKRRGREYVRFKVHPDQRDTRRTITAEAEVVDRRHVRNSGGSQSLRPVIETTVELMGEAYEIELTLVARDEMGFRMLLGRQAIRKRFLVDTGRSYLSGGGPKRKRSASEPEAKRRVKKSS